MAFGTKETRGIFSHGCFIEDRPGEVLDCNISDSFEVDTALFRKRKGKTVALGGRVDLRLLDGLMSEIVP